MANSVGWSKRVLAGAALAACIVGGIAATVQDKFNGSELSSFWSSSISAQGAMTVSGGKLNFSCDSSFSQGLIVHQSLALSATKNWTMSFDYVLNQGDAPDNGAWSGLIAPFGGAADASPSVLAIVVYRSAQGTFLGTIDTSVSAGNSLIPVPVASIPAQGNLVIGYNAKKDRLQVWVNNQSKLVAKRFNALRNPGDVQNFILLQGLTDADPVLHADDSEPPVWVHTNGMQADNLRVTGKGVVPVTTVD